jgi:hypothetical protein
MAAAWRLGKGIQGIAAVQRMDGAPSVLGLTRSVGLA